MNLEGVLDMTEQVKETAEEEAQEKSTESNTTSSTNEEVTFSNDTIREALRAVMDPELHLDVVALGLIKTIDIENKPIEVKMLLTTPFCPYGPWMVGQVKETAQNAANGQEVKGRSVA